MGKKDLREYYVYEYIRLDYYEPFYIGKGKGNRWRDKKSRSKYFLNICKSVPVAVCILEDNLTEDEAFKTESWYIWKLRDMDGFYLVNQTDGGEGGNSLASFSEERMAEYRKNMSEKLKGRVVTEEHKRKIGLALKNRKFTKETREKISKALKGKKYSEERKQFYREANKGEGNPMYGKKQTEKAKSLISEKNKKKVVVVDKNGNIVKEFASSNEAKYSDWRKQFPKPNGINYVSKCITNGIEFHGYMLMHKKVYDKKHRSKK